MTYISLYRKYRSQTFDEVVGQEPIIRTLKNAVANNRLSHAYLFAGPRGTGKTSTARIFAKALNCKEGSNPCGKCELCVKIKDGSALNVIEIDAASNRGIDEIRDLRERVRYAPVEGKYKIYIIDEVHMLTTEAFNALLKTLEEPPRHTIFVLATTEPQKVPLTILSRCQRFDFARIQLPEIVKHLTLLAQKESIKIDESALNLIARSAEGSMRDAISLLDQLVSFCGTEITLDDVVTILGTADTDLLFEFAEGVSSKDTARVLELVDRAVNEGRSIPQVTKDLIGHFRYLLLMKLGCHALIELTADHMERLKKDSQVFTVDELKSIIRILSRAETDMKWHPNARLALEVALIEMIGAEGPKEEIPKETPKEIRKEVSREDPKVSQPNIDQIKENWQKILERVKSKSLPSYVSLHEGEPVEINKGKLIIRFPKGFAFHKDRLEEENNRKAVQQAFEEVFEFSFPIACILDAKEREVSPRDKAQEVSVEEVADIFDGKVIS